MGKTAYEIAGFSFAVVAEAPIEIRQEAPFSDFVTTEPEAFTFFCKKGLPPPSQAGVLYFRDNRNLIYKDVLHVQRYLGTFHPDSDWSDARSCLCLAPDGAKSCELYLQEKQEPFTEREIFNAIGLEYALLLGGKAILHSAYITYEDRGILFTAPSGTGKSTQAALWKQVFSEKVEIINGDRSVLGVENGQATVYGLPFCGSSRISRNQSAPLSGIVVLRQGKENQICRMDRKTAVKLLFSECSVNLWDRIGVERLLETLEEIVGKIPVWYFSCLPDASAVHALKKEIQ